MELDRRGFTETERTVEKIRWLLQIEGDEVKDIRFLIQVRKNGQVVTVSGGDGEIAIDLGRNDGSEIVIIIFDHGNAGVTADDQVTTGGVPA